MLLANYPNSTWVQNGSLTWQPAAIAGEDIKSGASCLQKSPDIVALHNLCPQHLPFIQVGHVSKK